MRPEDAKKLLGGYATGTLTDAEQSALFAAALEDQELFDALAREQSLREVLSDPAVKAELLAALDEPARKWWQWRPAAVLAVTALTAIAVVMLRPNASKRTVVAELRTPVVQAPAPPATVTEQAAAAPPSTPLKARISVRRMSAETVEQKAAEVPRKEQGFERPPSPDALAGAAVPPRALPAPPPPPPAASMSLVPRDNVEPMQMKAELRAATGALSARDLFYAVPAPTVRLQAVAETAARRAMGLRYTVLRKEGAEFVEADPEALKVDDVVALRFTANTNGFLSIDGGTPVAITAMQPYTTGPIGGAEVKVVFTRTPETSAEGSVTTERRGRETFVVNTPPATAVTFTIALKRS